MDVTRLRDLVDTTLEAHGAPGRVVSSDVGLLKITLLVKPERDTAPDDILALKGILAGALAAPACEISRAAQLDASDPTKLVKVTIPNPKTSSLDVSAIIRANQPIPPMTATLGCNLYEDSGLFARLTAKEAHHILATGPGARDLAKVITLSLAYAHPAQAACIAAGKSLADLGELVGFTASPDGPTVAREAARIALDCSNGNDKVPKTVLLFDDLSGLPTDAMTSLLEHGHQAGIHIIAANRQGSDLDFPLQLEDHGGIFTAHVCATGDVIPFLPAKIRDRRIIEGLSAPSPTPPRTVRNCFSHCGEQTVLFANSSEQFEQLSDDISREIATSPTGGSPEKREVTR